MKPLPERRELPRAERRQVWDTWGKLSVAAKLGIMDGLGVSIGWDAITALIDDIEFGRRTLAETLDILQNGID